jgi:hypothetical protein
LPLLCFKGTENSEGIRNNEVSNEKTDQLRWADSFVILLELFFIFGFVFGSSGVWTQGWTLARHAFYYLGHSTRCLSSFWRKYWLEDKTSALTETQCVRTSLKDFWQLHRQNAFCL